MVKNFLIFILVLIILILGYSQFRNREVKTRLENETLTQEKSTDEEIKNLLKDDTSLTIQENSGDFRIDVKYPSFGYKNIDRELENFAQNTASEFKTNSGVPPEDSFIEYYSLGVKYRVVRSSKITSIIFDIEQYSGGAHGNASVKTFNYVNETGERLYLGSLFAPESSYLGLISKISREKLRTNPDLDPTQINAGTEPVSDNFSTFWIEDGNILKITFQSYQVGPGVVGQQTISIDMNREFKDILNEKYR